MALTLDGRKVALNAQPSPMITFEAIIPKRMVDDIKPIFFTF